MARHERLPRRATRGSAANGRDISSLYKLRRWTLGLADDTMFFTAARPGRKFSSVDPVADKSVKEWMAAVRALGPLPTVISMLGRKPDGMSEFAFYSFIGGYDTPQDHPGKASFAQWLATNAPEISLVEHPTIDFNKVPQETLDAIEFDLRASASHGRTVLIIDSGGETRTAQVCKHVGASEAFPTIV